MAGREWGRIARHSIPNHVKNGTLFKRVKRDILPRVLVSDPEKAVGTHSSARLNALYAGMLNCGAYLEIGVDWGDTFEAVRVPFRWGVDPFPNLNLRRLPRGARFSSATSDDFFRYLPAQQFFDLVFVDGHHEWRQTYRDVLASLQHSPPHAVIVVDDVVPDDEFAALPDQARALELRRAAGDSSTRWQGNVYKVVLAMIDVHPEIDFRVIDGRHAQAVLWKRASPKSSTPGQLEARLSAIDALEFADVFVDGKTPESFRLVDENAAIQAALDASHAVWDANRLGAGR